MDNAFPRRAFPTDDVVQPFQIEASALRGRFIRLGPSLDQILSAHGYPEPVARLLGETVVLAALLAAGLKYDGAFTLQTKGDGPVTMMVVDATSDGDLRGYAKVDEARLPATGPFDVPRLLGKGSLAFTVDQGEFYQRYQGMVALYGETLADCIQHYFLQSDQMDAGLKLAVDRIADGWRGAGLMIQRLPDETIDAPASDRVDDWRRAMLLMDTATPGEMLDPALSPNGLLYRLFHEDGVRVFEPSSRRRGCRCTRERVAGILASLPPDQVEDYLVDGEVTMNCEFCNISFAFDREQLRKLFDEAGPAAGA